MHIFLILIGLWTGSSLDKPQPIELGKVQWLRNYNEAIQVSSQEKKPIFLLFQEVPGCHTCSQFGKNVMSHPFIVEAIETYFVPLAIFNNKDGHDRQILEQFKEPSWNNPVVRIVDQSGKDIVERESGRYSEAAILGRIVEVMYANNLIIPDYLKIYQEELDAQQRGIEETTLSMYCFWTGEKELGRINGVVETEAGFMDGREVVKVKFDPSILAYQDLLKNAKDANCADAVYTHNDDQKGISAKNRVNVKAEASFRRDKESKYYLLHSAYKAIPMTSMQATKINSLLGRGIDPAYLLSPRQKDMMKNDSKANCIGKDITEAWWTKA